MKNFKKIILIILLFAVPALAATALKTIKTTNANRLLQSSGGAVAEAPAITANRALMSDANGIPTHSVVTSTELGYLSGVTSNIQTQIDGLGGGGGTPGGADTQIQFNDGGAFGGDAGLTYAKTTDIFSSDYTAIHKTRMNSYWGIAIPTILGTGIGSGGTTSGNFPAWAISTPDTSTSNGTSSIVINPGNATGAGANADGGGIFGIAGSASDALAVGGDIQFNAGDNPSGTSGNVFLNAGTGVSSKGYVRLTGDHLNFNLDNITASRVPYVDASKDLVTSSVTSTELGYLSGVTSSIQTQLGLKAPLASPTFSGTITTPLTASRAVVTGASSELAASSVTSTELGYVSGVTSSIQTQLGTKIGGALGSTDNVLLRSDGTGGLTAQGSTVSLGDTGALNNTATADVILLSLKSSVTTPSVNFFEIRNSANSSRFYIDPQGIAYDNGGYYTFNSTGFKETDMRTAGNGYLVFNAGPAWAFTGLSTTSFDSIVRIQTHKNDVPALDIKQKSGQTADLQKWSNSSGTAQSKVTTEGVYVPKGVTADPCADTTGFPSDSLWMNTTSHYLCTCVAGADKKASDGTTDCF